MPSDLALPYDEHAPALFAFLLNFTRDVLQDIFITLARQPGLLDSARDERALSTLGLDYLRRQGFRLERAGLGGRLSRAGRGGRWLRWRR